MKSFIVNSNDLFDRRKNPKLSLSPRDILRNPRIPKSKANVEAETGYRQAKKTELGSELWMRKKHDST